MQSLVPRSTPWLSISHVTRKQHGLLLKAIIYHTIRPTWASPFTPPTLLGLVVHAGGFVTNRLAVLLFFPCMYSVCLFLFISFSQAGCKPDSKKKKKQREKKQDVQVFFHAIYSPFNAFKSVLSLSCDIQWLWHACVSMQQTSQAAVHTGHPPTPYTSARTVNFHDRRQRVVVTVTHVFEITGTWFLLKIQKVLDKITKWDASVIESHGHKRVHTFTYHLFTLSFYGQHYMWRDFWTLLSTALCSSFELFKNIFSRCTGCTCRYVVGYFRWDIPKFNSAQSFRV